MSNLDYRRDIDGLRAIAVIAVILFHAGVDGFGGGFLGVDVFFVISGYLITQLILKELAEGRFSLLNFYERRARRIMPALTVVLLTTSVMSFLLMSPTQLLSYSKSLISTVTFWSNIYFYRAIDYFSLNADEMPLIHTWSLAVEEQYYFLFPLLILFLWRLNAKVIGLTVLCLAIVSLAWSGWAQSEGLQSEGFFLLPARGWQLLAGALISIYALPALKISTSFREVLAILGLVVLFGSIVVFDAYLGSPNLLTMAPIFGTMLVITCANEQHGVGRLLASKPLVGFGLISYSLYLWHQPLFAFLRMKTVGEPSELSFAIASIVAIALACGSYRFVEQPFRNRAWLSRTQVFLMTGGSTLMFLAVGLWIYVGQGLPERFGEPFSKPQSSPMRAECHATIKSTLTADTACEYFTDNTSWAVVGDSHSVEIGYSLAKQLEANGEGVLHLSYSTCPAILNFESAVKGCGDWFGGALRRITQDEEIKNVVLAYRYSLYLFGDHTDSYPDTPDENPNQIVIANASGLSAEDARNLLWRGYEDFIAELLASGKRVFLVYPVPELPIDIRTGLVPFSIFHRSRLLPLKKTTTLEYYHNRQEFILSKLDGLEFNKKLIAIKPTDLLCGEEYCPAAIEDQILYFDDDHLSVGGAKILLDRSVELQQAIRN